MALTHQNAAKNAAIDAITALINVGGAGTLVFATGADVEVATLTFNATAFGAAAAGVATANTITPDSSATGNASAVDKFIVKSGAGTEIFRGSVGTAGADINLSTTTIDAGDTVSLSTLTYTGPTYIKA